MSDQIRETKEIESEILIPSILEVDVNGSFYQLEQLEALVDGNNAVIEYSVANNYGDIGFTIWIEYTNGDYRISNPGHFPELEHAVYSRLNTPSSLAEATDVNEVSIISEGAVGSISRELIEGFISANSRQLSSIRHAIFAKLNDWQRGIEPRSPIGSYPNLIYMVVGSLNVSFVKVGNYLVPSSVCKSSSFSIGDREYELALSKAQNLLINNLVEA